MKKRIASVSLVVMLLITAVPSFALDPIIIPGPILVLSPCLLADASANIGTINSIDVQTGADYWISVDNFDIIVSGATVGRVISHYQRLTFGSTNRVAKEDTMIIDALGVTVFGRSFNTAAGHPGSRGLILGAIDNRGSDLALKGTYIITEETPRRICFFLNP